MSGRVLCDYCGCPPAKHERLQEEEEEEWEEWWSEEEEEGGLEEEVERGWGRGKIVNG